MRRILILSALVATCAQANDLTILKGSLRSEERRVGKECRL